MNKKLRKIYRLFTALLFGGAVIAGFSGLLTAAPAQPGTNKACIQAAKGSASVVNNGGSVTGRFRIPEKCSRERITLVVYKINDGNWQNKINNQFIFAQKSNIFGTGVHAMTVNTPNCAWQADLLIGHAANISRGEEQPPFLASRVGGNGVPCKKAPTPPANNPPADNPSPAPGNDNQNNNGNNNGNNNTNNNGNTNDNNNTNNNTNNNSNTNTNTNTNSNTVNVTTAGTNGASSSASASSSSSGDGDQEVSATSSGDAELTGDSSDGKNEGTLPDTGPGDVVATVMSISGLSGLLYPVVARRFGL